MRTWAALAEAGCNPGASEIPSVRRGDSSHVHHPAVEVEGFHTGHLLGPGGNGLLPLHGRTDPGGGVSGAGTSFARYSSSIS